MISIQVEKSLGDFSMKIDLTAPCHGITALYGPSGAGKTSLINMTAGLVKPDSGHLSVNGRILFDKQKRINLAPEHRRIGYVFQDGRLFPHLSVESNLIYGMRRTPEKERRLHPDQVVELLGIGHLLHRRTANLSGGEKQRVAIGRALLTSPELLLMDEPLASLDEERKVEILPFIADLAGKYAIPVLYVSHMWDEIKAIAAMIIILKNGRIEQHMPNSPELNHQRTSPSPSPTAFISSS